MTTFIYQYALGSRYDYERGTQLFKELDKTHAYLKLEEDKFFMVTVRKNGGDKDCKKVARQFASDKLERVFRLYQESNGRLVSKGKNHYRIVTAEELSELKKQVYFKNTILDQILVLQSRRNRGASWERVVEYKKAQKSIKRAKKS